MLLQHPFHFGGFREHQVEPLRHREGHEPVELELDLGILVMTIELENVRLGFHVY